MFKFLQKLLKHPASESAPASELAIYPYGDHESPVEAIAAGIARYRSEGSGRRAVISWQGQGGRPDSYEIFDVHVEGEVVDFHDLKVDLPGVCAEFDLDPAICLPSGVANKLDVKNLAPGRVAKFLEYVFVRQLGSRPFSDTGEYAVGVEYGD